MPSHSAAMLLMPLSNRPQLHSELPPFCKDTGWVTALAPRYRSRCFRKDQYMYVKQLGMALRRSARSSLVGMIYNLTSARC